MSYPQGQMSTRTGNGRSLHVLIHQVVHRAFPQTPSFRKDHSTTRRPKSSPPLLLQTAIENKVAIIFSKESVYSYLTFFVLLFFWTFKELLKNRSRSL